MDLVPLAPFDGEAIVSIEEAMTFLRADASEDRLAVQTMRDAAINWVERRSRQGLSRRQWRLSTTNACPVLRIAFGPVATITSVTIHDQASSEILLAPADWTAAIDTVRFGSPARWRGAQRVVVIFDAGYANVAAEAPHLLAAVKLLMLHLWDGGGPDEAPASVTMMTDLDRTPVLA